MFDYAHLRVPLPKDLEGSGIFARQRNHHYPEAYFLMVSTAPCPHVNVRQLTCSFGRAETVQRRLH